MVCYFVIFALYYCRDGIMVFVENKNNNGYITIIIIIIIITVIWCPPSGYCSPRDRDK